MEVVHESVQGGGNLIVGFYYPIMSSRLQHLLIHFLQTFFTAVLRLGYIPSLFRGSILHPISKGLEPSDSSNYCGIPLASCVSKVLEWSILLTRSQLWI